LLCHSNQTGVPVCADQQNPQAVGVREIETRVMLRQLLPKLMDTKIVAVNTSVMKEHYATVRELG